MLTLPVIILSLCLNYVYCEHEYDISHLDDSKGKSHLIYLAKDSKNNYYTCDDIDEEGYRTGKHKFKYLINCIRDGKKVDILFESSRPYNENNYEGTIIVIDNKLSSYFSPYNHTYNNKSSSFGRFAYLKKVTFKKKKKDYFLTFERLTCRWLFYCEKEECKLEAVFDSTECCGNINNKIYYCKEGYCCSKYVYCGLTKDYCNFKSQRYYFPITFEVSNNSICGVKYGYFGKASDHCNSRCQAQYGLCK